MSLRKATIIGVTSIGIFFGGLLGLSACSTTQQSQSAYAISAAYTTAHGLVVQYTKGTFGTPDTRVENDLLTLDKNASDALVTVDTAERDGTGLGSTAVALATQAVTALADYLSTHNIGKTTGENK